MQRRKAWVDVANWELSKVAWTLARKTVSRNCGSYRPCLSSKRKVGVVHFMSSNARCKYYLITTSYISGAITVFNFVTRSVISITTGHFFSCKLLRATISLLAWQHPINEHEFFRMKRSTLSRRSSPPCPEGSFSLRSPTRTASFLQWTHR